MARVGLVPLRHAWIMIASVPTEEGGPKLVHECSKHESLGRYFEMNDVCVMISHEKFMRQIHRIIA
jgi:hypothetical protein